jgi:flagella basal body P-ring formation protein FlgA
MRSLLTLFVMTLSVGPLSDVLAATGGGGTVLVLKQTATVRGPEILLGDVAEVRESGHDDRTGLAAIPVGPSPMPGETRIISQSDLTRLLKAAALPDANVNGAPQVRVSRSSRTLAESEVAPVLRAHVAAITAWQPDEIDVRAVRNLAGIQIPEGDTTLRFAQKSAPSSFGSLLLALEVSVEGKPVRTVWISADVRIKATLLQAARRLRYGAVLTDGDVRPVRVEVPDPRESYIRSSDAAVGKVLRRNLKPGDLITEDALSEPMVVHMGQTVRLRFEKSNIRVTMPVRAEQSGWLGQSIRVRNLEFARSMKAVVVGPGEVLIQ